MIHCEEGVKLINQKCVSMSVAMSDSVTDVFTFSSYLNILCRCILETPPHIHRKDIFYWQSSSDRLCSHCVHTCSNAASKRKNLIEYLLEKPSQLAQHPLHPPQKNTLICAPFILIPESHMQHDLWGQQLKRHPPTSDQKQSKTLFGTV